MKRLATTLVIGFMVASLVACEDMSKQNVGAATGALVGGALASTIGKGSGQTAAIFGGTIAGALIGGSIGKTMDQVDRMNVNKALEKTPTNQAYSWTNPDTGNAYTVKPTKTVTANNGQPCREYTTTAMIGGRSEQIYGKACRDAAGDWKVS